MAVEDWIPDMWDPDMPLDPECRHCGKPIAFQRDGFSMKWRPVDPNGREHRCRVLYATARDFPDLEE